MPPSALVGSLKRTARRFGGRLLRFGAPAYLKRKLATSEDRRGVRQAGGPGGVPRVPGQDLSASRAVEEGEEDLLPEVSLEDGEDKDPRDLEYVFVEPDDVMISVADFVAACVAAHPDAADAAPEELQRAVARALRELREPNRGKVRRVWDYGVGVYRGVAWTYSTLTSFTNPWIARLVVCAVYTSARIALGARRRQSVTLGDSSRIGVGLARQLGTKTTTVNGNDESRIAHVDYPCIIDLYPRARETVAPRTRARGDCRATNARAPPEFPRLRLHSSFGSSSRG